jgi:hypothetical protein
MLAFIILYYHYKNLHEIYAYLAVMPTILMMQLRTNVIAQKRKPQISIRKTKISVSKQIIIKSFVVFRDSPEYQPRHYNQRRDLRRYLLSNKRTELHILQGDILQTKVDAIVNGLSFY